MKIAQIHADDKGVPIKEGDTLFVACREFDDDELLTAEVVEIKVSSIYDAIAGRSHPPQWMLSSTERRSSFPAEWCFRTRAEAAQDLLNVVRESRATAQSVIDNYDAWIATLSSEAAQ